MTAIPKHRMTADEFLVWAEAQPKEAGKFELIDGEIFVVRGPATMQSERAVHSETKGALYRALHDAIKRAGLSCFVMPDGASIRLSDTRVVEPDALVYCGNRVPRDALHVPDPVIVVEVVSPSSQSVDALVKLKRYFNNPSIIHYLIVITAKKFAVHHQRQSDGKIVSSIYGSGVIRFDPPGIELDLDEVLAVVS